MFRRMCGDTERIVKSFVSGHHPDAIEWQRSFRVSLYTTRTGRHALNSEIHGTVYLIASKHSIMKYLHAIRVPYYRRLLVLSRFLTKKDCDVLASGGLPKAWYPRNVLSIVLRSLRGSPILTNDYIDREPLPWESCSGQCCIQERHKRRRRHQSNKRKRVKTQEIL